MSNLALQRGDVESETPRIVLRATMSMKGHLRSSRALVESLESETNRRGTEADERSEWEKLGVGPELARALLRLGFTTPTLIQKMCLPHGIRHRLDLFGAAETGSGKTLAFALPLLQDLVERHGIRPTVEESVDDREHVLHTLILTPTRELARQVVSHIDAVRKECPELVEAGVRIVSVIGGLSSQKQQRLLSYKPEVIVATPGRLWQLMEDGGVEIRLGELRFLIIDEADRMMEAGKFEEVISILKRIRSEEEQLEGECDLPPDESELVQGEVLPTVEPFIPRKSKRQSCLFSATLMSFPLRKKEKATRREVRSSETGWKERLIETISCRNKVKICDASRKGLVASTLVEWKVFATKEDKDFFLVYILMADPKRTLVFVNSIDSARRLTSVLAELRFSVFPLHSHMQQRQRLRNIDRFQSDDSSVLVATDVAARGLDIHNVPRVVHYQTPRSFEIYVHRSGRAGRAQQVGETVVFVGPDEQSAYRLISRASKCEIPDYAIDFRLMGGVRKRVSLARQIETAAHRLRKEHSDTGWIMQAAEKMDVAVDDGLFDDEDGSQRRQLKRTKLAVAELKEELYQLLSIPLELSVHSKRFITDLDVPSVAQHLDAAPERPRQRKRKRRAPETSVPAKRRRP